MLLTRAHTVSDNETRRAQRVALWRRSVSRADQIAGTTTRREASRPRMGMLFTRTHTHSRAGTDNRVRRDEICGTGISPRQSIDVRRSEGALGPTPRSHTASHTNHTPVTAPHGAAVRPISPAPCVRCRCTRTKVQRATCASWSTRAVRRTARRHAAATQPQPPRLLPLTTAARRSRTSSCSSAPSRRPRRAGR